MMTLQNEPPSLESVSEYEDQYKNYGKSIRKLIVECLQKDPAKRPTASELLKHPFIKKAKDRRYLLQTLLPNTPSFAERSRRALDAKRGFEFDSGNDGGSGSWVWPQDDCVNQQNLGENMFISYSENTGVLNNVDIADGVGDNSNQQRTTVDDAGGHSQSCSGSSVTSSNATDGVASSLKSNDLYEEQRLVNYAIDGCSNGSPGQVQQKQQVNQIQQKPELLVVSPTKSSKPKQQLQRSRSCDDSSNANNLRTINQQATNHQQQQPQQQANVFSPTFLN